MWCLQAATANLIVVYEGDTGVVVERFRPGHLEADLWVELVTTSAKGILRDSSSFRVAPGGTIVACGEYRFYAARKAGEQQLGKAAHAVKHGPVLQTADTG